QYHSLALLADRSVRAWGSNQGGQTAVPASLNEVLAIAGGEQHSLALRGTAADTAPVISVQPVATVSAAVGQVTRLSVTASAGTAPVSYQWRRNGVEIAGATGASLELTVDADTAASYDVFVSNRLGSLTSAPAAFTLRSNPLLSATQGGRATVARGGNLALELDPAFAPVGSTVKWLRNGREIPQATGTSLTFSNARALRDAGRYQAVVTDGAGTKTSRSLWLFVTGATQVVGWGDKPQSEVPTGLGDAVAIAGGTKFSLALKADGTVVGWGDNTWGQTNIPAGLSNVVRIAAGEGYSLALRSDGTVVSWGRNESGVPVGQSDFVAIAAGVWHGVALKSDGTVLPWGANGDGQSSVPSDLGKVVDIGAGAFNTMAVKPDGVTVEWGVNNSNQRNVPASVVWPLAVAGGNEFSAAALADGTVNVWGRDLFGEKQIPANVSGVVRLAAANYHLMAITSEGTLFSWGRNNEGQTAFSPLPGGFFDVDGGEFHTIALRDAAGDTLPVISSAPPSTLAAAIGQTVVLRVASSGGQVPVSYQWRKGGVAISGATNAEYRLTVDASSAANYTVTVSNYLGSVTSSATALTLRENPLISTNMGGRFVINGGQGRTFDLDPALAPAG
ncbi:MAG: hypothetical protein FJ284_15725, partial [Planctomycetes bacterium]|nr:hypothetical protein [Planctomycetota bacterium]